MKKEIFVLFLIILLPSLTIVSAKIFCSDGSSVQSNQNEIDEYTRKEINGLRLALSESTEYNVLQTTEVKLILEATLVSLTNENPSQEIELSTGKYIVNFSNVSSLSSVKISIDGTSKTLIKNKLETIKSLPIILLTAQADSPDTQSAEIIIGSQQIFLSSNEELSKKINVTNLTYFIELITASDTNAIIKVSKCKSGEILEEKSPNKTQEANNTTIFEANNTENTNNTGVASENKTLNNTNQDETANQQNQQENPGFFKKIINWFKKLFSWI